MVNKKQFSNARIVKWRTRMPLLILLSISLVAVFLLPLAPNVSIFILDFLTRLFIYATLALVWGYSAAFAGLVSLGNQAFIGIGGYVTAVLVEKFGYPLMLSGLIAVLISGLLAFAIAFPLLQLRGIYFSIGTLLVAEILRSVFLSWEYVGGGRGFAFRSVYGQPITYTYYPSLVILIVVAIVLYKLYYSKLGYGLRSVGDDEDAARGVGVNVALIKAFTFTLTGIICGCLGVVNAIYVVYLHPNGVFSISWTVAALFAAIIGGVGTIAGSLIGGAIYTASIYFLATLPGYSLLVQGAIVAILMLIFPEGIWRFIRRTLRLQRLYPL
jgi:branched-chain amino acid transport system permease protein